MANELPVVEKAIYQRLSKSPDADALTNIIPAARMYARRAIQKPTYPYILWTWQGGDESSTLNKTRLIVEPVYYVRVIDKLPAGSSSIPDDVKNAADQIDSLLQNMRRKSYPAISGYFFNSWREKLLPLSSPDPNDAAGEIYQLGGLYHVQIFS